MLALTVTLAATSARAGDDAPTPPPLEPSAEPVEPPAHTMLHPEPVDVLKVNEPATLKAPVESPAYGNYFQIGSGLNVGLLDLLYNSGQVWVELSTVLGVPILSNSSPMFAVVMAAGYSLDLGDNGYGHWYFELFVELTAAHFSTTETSFVGGAGWGFGFRYVLPNGWAMALRAPVFGMAVRGGEDATFDTATSVGDFYLSNAFGWSFFTFGRRF